MKKLLLLTLLLPLLSFYPIDQRTEIHIKCLEMNCVLLECNCISVEYTTLNYQYIEDSWVLLSKSSYIENSSVSR